MWCYQDHINKFLFVIYEIQLSRALVHSVIIFTKYILFHTHQTKDLFLLLNESISLNSLENFMKYVLGYSIFFLQYLSILTILLAIIVRNPRLEYNNFLKNFSICNLQLEYTIRILLFLLFIHVSASVFLLNYFS